MYQQGIALHCPDENDGVDPVLVRPLPVVIHIDKMHADLFRNCTARSPIQMMLAMANVNAQQVVTSWWQIATIPILSIRKGEDARTTNDSLNKLKDYHKVLKVALSLFMEKYSEGGIMWRDNEGRAVLLKPYIHMSVGDTTSIISNMVGHYNTCKAKCVTKDCTCQFSDLVTFPPKCRQTRYRDIKLCSDVREVFHKYSLNG